MSYPSTDITIHSLYHSPQNPEYFCDHCERYIQIIIDDNLFSGNHRTKMIERHGYTAAMNLYVTPGSLELT